MIEPYGSTMRYRRKDKIMAIREILGVKTTAEISARRVHGVEITLTAHGISVTVPLREWNLRGLQAIVGGEYNA